MRRVPDFKMCIRDSHRGHVDMPFGNDDASAQFDFPFRTDEGASRCAAQIAGLADHAFDAETPRVRDGDLYLCFASARAEDDNFFKSALRARYSEPLFARILACLLYTSRCV